MMSRLMVLVLGSGLPGWAGWIVARDAGVLVAFLSANVCFAAGWYFSRKFVRNHLDL